MRDDDEEDAQPLTRVALRQQIDALAAENAALALARTRRKPMPDVPRMVPSRRCFARIDRYECACPHCGRLIFAGIDGKFLPKRLVENNRARAAAKARPRAKSVAALFWNPYTQRLVCPWCERVYTVGLLFYPVQDRGRKVTQPAPDTEPTATEVAEMRRLAGGWFVKRVQLPGDHANLHVQAECSCQDGGTDPACLLHGEAVVGRTSEGGESE
jgi:hypothetical protein